MKRQVKPTNKTSSTFITQHQFYSNAAYMRELAENFEINGPQELTPLNSYKYDHFRRVYHPVRHRALKSDLTREQQK